MTMFAQARSFLTLIAAILIAPASFAQVEPAALSSDALDTSADERGGKQVSPSRVLAGLRGYPSEIIEAVATLGGQKQWLDRTAERIRKNQPVEFDTPDMPADVKSALSKLARAPEVILIAA